MELSEISDQIRVIKDRVESKINKIEKFLDEESQNDFNKLKLLLKKELS